jgi:alpha-L-fucosidase
MNISRRRLIAGAGALGSAALLDSPHLLALPAASRQVGAPPGSPGAFALPKPDLAGPVQPTWESLRDHYSDPPWFRGAKIGIFIHWGLYAVPAHHSEWYSRFMYTTDAQWHTDHYGPPNKFGYKDFIPMFKAEQFRPEEWVSLFKRAGARYMCPVGEHSDGFAMWDSDITPWCAGKMGPKRDILGELEKAARRQNMIFGTSTHRMEHHNFEYPAPGIPNDEFDPRYAGFYGPPVPGNDMNAGDASEAFQLDWLARVQEMIDKYRPEILYMDNGVNPRAYDPVKLRAGAYLYNRALEHGYKTTIATKQWAYLFGNIQAFETAGGSPKWPYPGAWQCDTPIGNSWGYIKDLKVRSGQDLLQQMIAIVSCGGNYMLNVSPMADGTIPQDQQDALLVMGDWLKCNGEAIYGSTAWVKPGEGPGVPAAPPGDWRGWPTGMGLPPMKRGVYPAPPTPADFRFTLNNGSLYAIGLTHPEGNQAARLTTFRKGNGRIERVTLLDGNKPVTFNQTSDALICNLPPRPPNAPDLPYVLRLQGSMQSFGS